MIDEAIAEIMERKLSINDVMNFILNNYPFNTYQYSREIMNKLESIVKTMLYCYK